MANFIANYYCCNLGVAYSIFFPIEKSNLDSKNTIESNNLMAKNTLSKNQNEALNFILNHKKTLLFGDTGSGKTEIYIYSILKTLEKNKNVIFLMPEISLTPQMEARLKNIFGDLVCIWHSKITKANKVKLLNNFTNFRIIVGARSALFLPVSNLGLIIVDEEHDDAYKSNINPRYNARDLSIYLATKSNIKIILGSATPSVGSYFNFSKNNEIFRLRGQHFNTEKSIFFERSTTKITTNLKEKINYTLQIKKQIIVFIPIKANFKALVCLNCGESIKCKNCSISLSFHTKKNALICHYCGYAMPIEEKCPNCKNGNLNALKVGTQEIAKELKEIFINANIEIFDRDEVTTDKKLKNILENFDKEKIDILVGTQMISKGHDYPNVYLSVILGIDNLLKSNDYRGMEKALSLFFQISGRCGRVDNGEVYVQTLNESFFKNFINDYEDFIKFELKNRMDYYPPFVKLALISSTNKKDEVAKNNIESCKKIVESCKNIEIVGVNRAPIERIKNNWRYFMLIRSYSPKDLLNCVHLLKNMPCSIDIDPLQLL